MDRISIKRLSLESFADEPRVQNLQLLCAKFLHASDDTLEPLGLDIASQLSPEESDTLSALHNEGPLDPGHLNSKVTTDFLHDLGLVQMVVCKGEDGFWACTQVGHWVYKGIAAIKENPDLKVTQPGDLLGDTSSNGEDEQLE